MKIVTLLLGGTLLLSSCSPKKEVVEVSEISYASWFCDVPFWNPPDWEIEEGTITGDITKATGLALDISVPEEDASTRLGIKLVNDELPDIMTITDLDLVKKMIDAGMVWELEEFMETYAPESSMIEEFPQDIKKTLVDRDGVWCVFPSHVNSGDSRKQYPAGDPFYEELYDYAHNYGIIWNEELLKKAGFSVQDVQTETGALEALKTVSNAKLQVNGEAVIPFLIDGKGSFSVENNNCSLAILLDSFGAEYIDFEGNYQLRILQPQGEHALYFLNQLMRNGCLNMSSFTRNNDEIKQLIREERVVCFVGNLADAGISVLPYDSAKQWKSNGPIVSKDGAHPVSFQDSQEVGLWMNTLISKKCSNPKAIARWLDYMTSDEGRMLCQYGYPNVDYYLDEHSKVVFTERGMKNREDSSRTGIAAWWAFENTNWKYSKEVPPQKKTALYLQEKLRCQFRKHEKTVLIDYAPIAEMEGLSNQDGALSEKEIELYGWLNDQVVTLLVSNSDEEFEHQYQKMLEGTREYELKEVLRKKSQYLKKASKNIGIQMEKVNP